MVPGGPMGGAAEKATPDRPKRGKRKHKEVEIDEEVCQSSRPPGFMCTAHHNVVDMRNGGVILQAPLETLPAPSGHGTALT